MGIQGLEHKLQGEVWILLYVKSLTRMIHASHFSLAENRLGTCGGGGKRSRAIMPAVWLVHR